MILIRPAAPVTKTIARITLLPSGIRVLFPEKRDDFRGIVKGMGYIWDKSSWLKSAKNQEAALNQAAETGHQLLLGGFWVSLPTVEIQEMIVNESFRAEQKRTITVVESGDYAGWFRIWWARSEDCYRQASRITAARYIGQVVVVPPEYYDEVEDFSRLHNFAMSESAQRLAAETKANLETALLFATKERDGIPKDDDGIPVLDIPEGVGIDETLADYD